MNNFDQLIAQFSQIIVKVLGEITRLTDQVFISGLLGHLLALLKAIVQFIILAIEALVRILKFFVH